MMKQPILKISYIVCMILFTNAIHAQQMAITAPEIPDYKNGIIDTMLAKKAEDLVSDYLNAVLEGDTLTLQKILAVPFAWDKREIVESKTDLVNRINELSKKARKSIKKLENISIKTIDVKRTIVDGVIPLHLYIVQLSYDIGKTKHGTKFAIQINEPPVIVGFAD